MLTLVASALAGGDCIDDADVLRTGGTAQTLGCVVKAPSTLGTFLRSFRWGHVRSGQPRAAGTGWSAGAGPGDAPFTIDLDSTICETYGLAKEGARDHGYTGKRGYHPLLAVAAGTGDVLMARCARAGPTPLGVPPTSCVRRWGGCATPGPGDNSRCGPTAASTPTPSSPPAPDGCPLLHHRPQSASLRSLIEAIPEQDWTPIPYWMEGAAAVAETATSLPEQAGRRAGAAHRPAREAHARFPGELALFATYSYHGFITDREGETLALEADHRRHAEIENAIRDLKYGVGLNHLPSGRFPANGAWLAVQVIAHKHAGRRASVGEQM